MMMLSEAQETLIRELTIALPVAELTEDIVSQLKETINENRGNVTLRDQCARSAGRCGSEFVLENA